MNSTKILFLNMLKNDIKKHMTEKNNNGMLTGQTIFQSEIESLSSYKLMNDEEKTIIEEILKSFKKNSSPQDGKLLLKSIPGLVPKDTSEVIDFKDAA